MDREKKPKHSAPPAAAEASSSHLEEFFRSLQSSGPDSGAIAAATEAAQRLAEEADTEQAAEEATREIATGSSPDACRVCGHHNRPGTRFCGMCGVTLGVREDARKDWGAMEDPPEERLPKPGQSTVETHHYHHHYHHHYLPGAQDGAARAHDSARFDPGREEKMRPNAALRGDMSRVEAAVRRVTHEWVLACNTKHLDDLLDLYVADAIVLRSNYPPVRGAAAIREFFFGALDAGLGEVEVETLRVDVVGDLAYEAGRCKALVPGATGKRREERGKYLWVFVRQSNGEWRLAADCWSSDLSLTMLESDVPAGPGVKTRESRKG